jgi:hypothetical protein
MIASETRFYTAGGTLHLDAPSYVERRADTDLYDGLMRAEFCYVLTSRQMGKSSLMVRTMARLRQEGVAVVGLDLTRLGQNLTAEQWYDGLLGLVGAQLDLQDELEQFWFDHERLGPLQRFMAAIEQVVLKQVDARCSMLAWVTPISRENGSTVRSSESNKPPGSSLAAQLPRSPGSSAWNGRS